MSKAIEQLNSGLTVGHVRLGFRGGVQGTTRQEVHDGDTINVRAVGNLGVRFLGVDAPEISFNLPGQQQFKGLGHQEWQDFLDDPFSGNYPAFNPPLEPGLRAHLQARVGPGTAQNHYQHADNAENALEQEILNDIATLGQTEETFQFFLAFAHEVMDRYGRLLCYINRDQVSPNNPGPRPLSYNERLLAAGKVSPYFIWPNINPFRPQPRIVAAATDPATFLASANVDPALTHVRQVVQQHRQNQTGLFDHTAPLRLEPFEVRFLARRRPPDRWVIDLTSNNHLLIKPQNYHTVPNVEDRLFIPEEYVPLFVERGWQIQP